MAKEKQPVGMQGMAGRQSAAGVLDDKIKRAERRVEILKALKLSINWDNLPPEREEKLWSLMYEMGC